MPCTPFKPKRGLPNQSSKKNWDTEQKCTQHCNPGSIWSMEPMGSMEIQNLWWKSAWRSPFTTLSCPDGRAQICDLQVGDLKGKTGQIYRWFLEELSRGSIGSKWYQRISKKCSREYEHVWICMNMYHRILHRSYIIYIFPEPAPAAAPAALGPDCGSCWELFQTIRIPGHAR